MKYNIHTTKFTDRRGYYNFVKQWKKDYFTVSNDLRTIRKETKGIMGLGKPAAVYQRARLMFAQRATELLEIRMASKLEAGKQRAFAIANPESNSQGASAAELRGGNQ